MHILYDFFSSVKFKIQIEGIVDGLTQMLIDLISEKRPNQG